MRRQAISDWLFILEECSNRRGMNKILAEGRRMQSQVDAFKNKLRQSGQHWIFVDSRCSTRPQLFGIYVLGKPDVPIGATVTDYDSEEFVPAYFLVNTRGTGSSKIIDSEDIRIVSGELKASNPYYLHCRVTRGRVTYTCDSRVYTLDIFFEWASTGSLAAETAMNLFDMLKAKSEGWEKEHLILMDTLFRTRNALEGLKGNSPNYRLLYGYFQRLFEIAATVNREDPTVLKELAEAVNNFPKLGGRE